MKIVNEYMPVSHLVFLRYFLTAIASFFIALFFRQKFFIDKISLIFAIVTALLTTIYTFLVFIGTKLGTASLAGAFINTLSPISTFILLALFYKRKIVKFDVLALFLGFVGAMMILGIWRFDAAQFLTTYNLCFVLAAWLWSALTISSSHSKINPVVFSFYMYSFVAFFSFIFLDVKSIDFPNTDGRFWINMLFMSVVSTSIASTIFFIGTKKLGAQGVSSFMFLTPFSAIGFGALLLGEEISFFTILGTILALIAVYMLNRIGVFKR